MNEHQHITPHVASIGGLLAAWLGWLPPLLAALASMGAFIYYTILILESDTFKQVQAWRARRKAEKKPDHEDNSLL